MIAHSGRRSYKAPRWGSCRSKAHLSGLGPICWRQAQAIASLFGSLAQRSSSLCITARLSAQAVQQRHVRQLQKGAIALELGLLLLAIFALVEHARLIWG